MTTMGLAWFTVPMIPSTRLETRLTVYRRETRPLIAYYEGSKAIVHYVQSHKGVEEVQGEVRKALGIGGVDDPPEDSERDRHHRSGRCDHCRFSG